MLDGVEAWDAGADEHMSFVGVCQPDPDEHMQVGRPAQGAAAGCGGGESQEVGDRSRADCGGPVEADVGVGWCVVVGVVVVPLPWDWGNDGPLSRGGPQVARGSTRVRR